MSHVPNLSKTKMTAVLGGEALWFNVDLLICVFAQIIVLLIVPGKCYSLCVVKDNLVFAINTTTANGWEQTGMYLTVQQILVQNSQMVKVGFVAGELIKKADITNTRFTVV